jgi:putative heme iron utilization protein
MSTPLPNFAKPARELVHKQHRGVLSTLSDQGFPYSSMVDYAPFENGDLLLLLSKLAEHTRFLLANPKCGMFVSPHLNDPDAFAKPRVTLLGEVAPIERNERVVERFLTAHPRASNYMLMRDFGFYRFQVESIRYIGGFGRMAWIEAEEYRAHTPV